MCFGKPLTVPPCPSCSLSESFSKVESRTVSRLVSRLVFRLVFRPESRVDSSGVSIESSIDDPEPPDRFLAERRGLVSVSAIPPTEPTEFADCLLVLPIPMAPAPALVPVLPSHRLQIADRSDSPVHCGLSGVAEWTSSLSLAEPLSQACAMRLTREIFSFGDGDSSSSRRILPAP
jgi:hypothetical protein